MLNSSDSISISYTPLNPGTAQTEVYFYSEMPDLISLYEPGKEDCKRRCFVTDGTVASLDCMKNFISCFDDGKCNQDVLLILGSGEPYKTIESVLSITQTAIDAGFTRKDLFVGIGGGVICDMTGFAASIFKRGVSCEFVPTTLLSMVDASIGGKTGCDFLNYKNMIGTFWPAQKIHMFTKFVNSLPEEQYHSGLGEVFKTALLFDRELFDFFKNNSELINKRDEKSVYKIIQKCAKAKSKVVQEDLTEKNIRMFLNLGHTFGHALETVAGLGAIPHGDAVAWGIGRAIELCYKEEICSSNYRNEVFEILEQYGWETKPIHPIVKGGGIGERLVSIMHKDKKNSSNKIKLTLQKGLMQNFNAEIDDVKILAVLGTSKSSNR